MPPMSRSSEAYYHDWMGGEDPNPEDTPWVDPNPEDEGEGDEEHADFDSE